MGQGVDLKYPSYNDTNADDFIQGDLRDRSICEKSVHGDIENVYQLAADMGGGGLSLQEKMMLT